MQGPSGADFEVMCPPRIIGLAGEAGSGKSTVADVLVQEFGFKLIKLAGPLKAMLRVLGLGDREIEGDLKEEPCDLLYGSTPRHAMQTLGTEWGREAIHPDLWTLAAVRRVNAAVAAGTSVVVDDVRYPNEVEILRQAGAEVVRITRSGQGGSYSHSSEAAVVSLDVDYEIFNRADLEFLKRRARRLVR